jgi:hypothetical protein
MAIARVTISTRKGFCGEKPASAMSLRAFTFSSSAFP